MTAVWLTSRVFVNMAVFAVFYLPGNGAMQAAGNQGTSAPKLLAIHVQAKGFGRASAADITAALQSAAYELWRHCPHTQLDAIEVYHRADHPQMDFKRTPDGRIAIGLATQDTRWAQYSFQFAHEFCHALANDRSHPQQWVHYARHANLWLEESLCETASLFTLRAMSRSWRIAPPYPAWRGYAPWLNAYAEQRLALAEHRLPTGTPFLAWFHASEPALRQNSGLRDQNTIIAIRLLPFFEAEPRGWGTVAFLHRDLPHANQSLAQHLGGWRSRCPAELRPFVTRLAAAFGVEL